MTRGPERIFEAVERDLGSLIRHHHDRTMPHINQAQQPSPPATEPPMSLIAEIKTDLATLAAKAGRIDDEAVAKLEALTASPEGAEVFSLVAALADSASKGAVPAGTLTTVASMLKGIVLPATVATVPGGKASTPTP